jgi:hypothetical protein
MRKLISILPIVIVSVIMILLSACGSFNPPTEDNPTSEIKLEKVMSEINHGLYKFQLNDSTTILIYRGVESCTMLQLK